MNILGRNCRLIILQVENETAEINSGNMLKEWKKMSILMYGAETWTWTEADTNRLTAAEMRF